MIYRICVTNWHSLFYPSKLTVIAIVIFSSSSIIGIVIISEMTFNEDGLVNQYFDPKKVNEIANWNHSNCDLESYQGWNIEDYVKSDQIIISGNDNLRSNASKFGWSGDGSISSPFIITGFLFNFSIDQDLLIYPTAIDISNTYLQLIIVNNIIVNNGIGISLTGSSNVTICNNYISNNFFGIRLITSDNILVTNNVIEQNRFGIDVDLDDFLYSEKPNPWEFSTNVVQHNIVSNNLIGISLNRVNNWLILENIVLQNNWGISLGELINWQMQILTIIGINTQNNVIYSNMIGQNLDQGIYISKKANENSIYNNSFISNCQDNSRASPAFDDGIDNLFNNNYWNTWILPDKDNNSIVDLPYLIDGNSNNSDSLPLMQYPSSIDPTIIQIYLNLINSGDLTFQLQQFSYRTQLNSFQMLIFDSKSHQMRKETELLKDGSLFG